MASALIRTTGTEIQASPSVRLGPSIYKKEWLKPNYDLTLSSDLRLMLYINLQGTTFNIDTTLLPNPKHDHSPQDLHVELM